MNLCCVLQLITLHTHLLTHIRNKSCLRDSSLFLSFCRGRTLSSWRRTSTCRVLWTGSWCSHVLVTTSCWSWRSRKSTKATSSSSPSCSSSGPANRPRTSPTAWSLTATAAGSPGRPRRAPSMTGWRPPSWTATAWCLTPPSPICSPTTATWGSTSPSPCADGAVTVPHRKRRHKRQDAGPVWEFRRLSILSHCGHRDSCVGLWMSCGVGDTAQCSGSCLRSCLSTFCEEHLKLFQIPTTQQQLQKVNSALCDLHIWNVINDGTEQVVSLIIN